MSEYNSNLINTLDGLDQYSVERRSEKLESENTRLRELNREMMGVLQEIRDIDDQFWMDADMVRELCRKILIKAEGRGE